MSNYLQVQVSAENKEQADAILNSLLAKKLVTGGLLLNSPARFLWKGELVDMDYFIVTSYTTLKNKEAVIEEVKKISIEEVPMISFTSFDGNQELLSWIDRTLD